MMPLYQSVDNSDDIYIRLDTIPQRDDRRSEMVFNNIALCVPAYAVAR